MNDVIAQKAVCIRQGEGNRSVIAELVVVTAAAAAVVAVVVVVAEQAANVCVQNYKCSEINKGDAKLPAINHC